MTTVDQRAADRALFSYRNAAAIVEAAYEQTQGVETEETSALEELEALQYETALEELARFVSSLERFDTALEAEAARIKLAREAVESRIGWARSRIRGLMTERGEEKATVGPFQVALHRSPPYLHVPEGFDPALLPPSMLRLVPATIQLDKNKIKAAINRETELAKYIRELGLDLRRGDHRVVIE